MVAMRNRMGGVGGKGAGREMIKHTVYKGK